MSDYINRNIQRETTYSCDSSYINSTSYEASSIYYHMFQEEISSGVASA